MMSINHLQTQAGNPPLTGADQLLQVTPADADHEVFVGSSIDYGPLRIYGGQFLGQALAAAFATLPASRLAHSLHAYFVSPGDPALPILYHVERLRDGGSYASRAVRAVQGERTVFFMTASFKEPEPGDVHQPAMPAVPGADDAAAVREADGRQRLPLPFTFGTGIELEVLDDWSPANPQTGAAAIRLWMRVPVERRESAQWQQCVLAFLSDSTLLFNALRPHGQPFATHRTTSLDHALWFHQVPACEHWMLYDQTGPAAADGRGFNQGFIYDTAGRLLATAAQEGMMRRN